MPSGLPITPGPELDDLAGAARTDGYVEVRSTLGYGILVVTTAERTRLLALGGGVSQVNTLSAHASTPATAGTFTITVNGQTTSAIAFDATAATIQAALEALSNVEVGDVVAVATTGANMGVAGAVVTMTWGGALAGFNVTASMTPSLTGNAHVFATPTPGGAWLAL